MIDACCLIDLLASGQAEAILRATGYAWHLPTRQAEVQYVRQHDPDNPGSYRNVPVDLTPLVTFGSAHAVPARRPPRAGQLRSLRHLVPIGW